MKQKLTSFLSYHSCLTNLLLIVGIIFMIIGAILVFIDFYLIGGILLLAIGFSLIVCVYAACKPPKMENGTLKTCKDFKDKFQRGCIDKLCEYVIKLSFRCRLIILYIVILIIAGIIAGIILYKIGLTFSSEAYFNTLSSVFQGLFSILALAGVFIIFRIEQLQRDKAKYENDIEKRFEKLRKGSCKEDIYDNALNKLDVLNMEFFEIVNSLERKATRDVDKEILKQCINKGELAFMNDCLIKELQAGFKLPFLTGMLLITFTLYFLPMLNSNSRFWFHIPANIIIGECVIFTIIVVLEIMCIIYYSMWSALAKRTL